MTDLVDMLEPGDVMVVNDTRVLPARLSLHRKTGGAAEVLLLEQRSSDFRLWEALVKPASKLKPDEVLEYFGKRVVRIGPRTEAGDTFVVEILDENPMELLQRIGAMPIADTGELKGIVKGRKAQGQLVPIAGDFRNTHLFTAIDKPGLAGFIIQV